MDATAVDSLLALITAICLLLLLYGGWLCLRYGRGMGPFRGNRKTFTAAARDAACFPAQAGNGGRKSFTPVAEDRGAPARERSQEILSR